MGVLIMSSMLEREFRKWGIKSPDHFQETMKGTISDVALEGIMKEVNDGALWIPKLRA